jgi:hypothetical protein
MCSLYEFKAKDFYLFILFVGDMEFNDLEEGGWHVC